MIQKNLHITGRSLRQMGVPRHCRVNKGWVNGWWLYKVVIQ